MKKNLLISGLLLLALGSSAWPVQAQEYHDCVVVVLDASGSMAGSLRGTSQNKIQAAKSALKEVLKQVPSSTYIGILVFSARNLKDDWVYPLGPRDDAALTRAIDLPEPNQGTPLGRYLKIGADRLLQERERQFGYGSYRLLVVTDGEAQDGNLVEQYRPEIMARGITLDVIGVGMNRNHSLATKVHSYRSANDPESLKRAVAEVFAEVAVSRTDVAGAEAFALLAPIPVEVAAAAIQALSVSGNQPIGAPPAVKASPPAPTPQPQARPSQQSQPDVRVVQHAPAHSRTRAVGGVFTVLLAGVGCFTVTLVLVIFLIIKAVRK